MNILFNNKRIKKLGTVAYTHRLLLASFVFFFLFTLGVKVFAVAWPYAPGTELDPGCAPTDPECIVLIFPDQTGKDGKFLQTNSGVVSWETVASGTTYTFSTGLNNASSTITNNLSTGVSGGQSVVGGTASGNDLTLSSTSNATKGKIIFGTSAYDEVNNRLGIGTVTPTAIIEASATAGTPAAIFANTATLGAPFVVASDSAGRGFVIGQSGLTPTNFAFGGVQFNANSTGGSLSAFSDINLGTFGDLLLQSGGGNVGIGTTTPDAMLDVAGSLYLTGTGSHLSINSSDPTMGGTIGGAGERVLRLDGEGTSIYSRGIITVNNPIALGSVTSGTYAGEFNFMLTSLGGYTTTGGILGTLQVFSSGSGISSGGVMAFFTRVDNTTGVSEKMRITATGNVGIGDTSPLSMFTVGNGDLFQVNSSGAIAAATGIASSGTINFSGLTASRAVVTDGSKNLASSATTSTELGYVSGVTSAIQTQLNAKGTFTLPSLTTGSVLFSNGSTIAQDNSNFFWDDSSNELGIGTATPSAFLHVLGTTEQQRLGYDASNYLSTTVSSTGGVTFNAVGAGSAFTFADSVTGTNFIGSNLGLSGTRIYMSGSSGTATFFNLGGGDAVQYYRLVNAGALNTAQFSLMLDGTSGTGNGGLMYSTQSLIWAAFSNNGSYIARASISISNTSNTATSETSDLILSAKGVGGSAMAEIMRLNSKVGINTGATISAMLHVVSTAEQQRIGYDVSNYVSTTVGSTGGVTFDAVGSGSAFTFSDGVTASSTVTFSGIGTNNGAAALCISAGVVTIASSSCTVPSALRFKHNVEDLSGNLDKVLALRPVSYISNNDSTENIGFIAEEVASIENRLVSYNTTGEVMGLNYAQFAPLFAGAIKELDLKVVGIENFSTDSTFATTLISWLANASNRITRIFTGEICLVDSDGNSECLNKIELMQLKSLLSTPPTPSVNMGGGTPDVVPGDDQVITEGEPGPVMDNTGDTTDETTGDVSSGDTNSGDTNSGSDPGTTGTGDML